MPILKYINDISKKEGEYYTQEEFVNIDNLLSIFYSNSGFLR